MEDKSDSTSVPKCGTASCPMLRADSNASSSTTTPRETKVSRSSHAEKQPESVDSQAATERAFSPGKTCGLPNERADTRGSPARFGKSQHPVKSMFPKDAESSTPSQAGTPESSIVGVEGCRQIGVRSSRGMTRNLTARPLSGQSVKPKTCTFSPRKLNENTNITPDYHPPSSRVFEDTHAKLFGEPDAPKKKFSARPPEDTHEAMFGKPETTPFRKSSRAAENTNNSLFGPPPEYPKVTRQRGSGSIDLLHHKPDGIGKNALREATKDRYELRNQDTQNKIFGPSSPRPPPKARENNIFRDTDPYATEVPTKEIARERMRSTNSSRVESATVEERSPSE